jgi:hypothetical protein
LIAAGRPRGHGRTTMTYHWAKDAGIRIDADDVIEVSAPVKRR